MQRRIAPAVINKRPLADRGLEHAAWALGRWPALVRSVNSLEFPEVRSSSPFPIPDNKYSKDNEEEDKAANSDAYLGVEIQRALVEPSWIDCGDGRRCSDVERPIPERVAVNANCDTRLWTLFTACMQHCYD